MKTNPLTRALCAAALCALSMTARADLLFSEPFNTDTSSTAETLATYSPPFTLAGSSTDVLVTGGVLNISPQQFPDFPNFYVSGFTGDLTLDVDLGKTPGGPDFNTGLVIGDNRLLFHPGYAGGAFRVEGPGGFFNVDMGFTPDAGVLHHMRVAITAATGEFDITVTDANNPANVFLASFTNPGYVPGGIIGLGTDGGPDAGWFAQFDNFTASSPAAVPEPGSVAFLTGILTLGGLVLRRRRK